MSFRDPLKQRRRSWRLRDPDKDIPQRRRPPSPLPGRAPGTPRSRSRARAPRAPVGEQDLRPQPGDAEVPRPPSQGGQTPGSGTRVTAGGSWAPKAVPEPCRIKASSVGPKLPSRFHYCPMLNNATKQTTSTFPPALPVALRRGGVTSLPRRWGADLLLNPWNTVAGTWKLDSTQDNGRVWTRRLTACRWEAEVQSLSHPQVGFGYEVWYLLS